MPTYSNQPKLGTQIPEFELPAVDGKTYSLKDFTDSRLLVVAFVCNHCPYVVATQGRVNAFAKRFQPQGVALVGINSNDAVKYPDDSFEAMKVRAKEQEFVFPYLHDESQEVARAFGAACTPEFFVYSKQNGNWTLKYQGRLDDNWKDESAVTRQDLVEAVEALLAGRDVNPDQKPAMGCSIKWR